MSGRRLPQPIAIVLSSLLFVTACSRAPKASEPGPGGGEWHEFQGTWTGAGNRYTMRFGRESSSFHRELQWLATTAADTSQPKSRWQNHEATFAFKARRAS